MRASLMILAVGVWALAVGALALPQARADTLHTATVRAKTMEEAQEYASQICGQYGKRAKFMFKEAGSDGLTVYYFACK